jgi:hypothetical protein
MSTQALYTRFRNLYQERSTRYFDTTWAIEAINDAIDEMDSEIADLHPEFAGMLSTTLSYTADTQERALPQGVVEVIAVEVTDRGGPPYPRLLPVDFRDRNRAGIVPSADWMAGSGTGEPAYYYVRSGDPADAVNQMGFIPIPSRTATNNVTVWYHGTRAEITTIDAVTYPDLPVDWHALIPHYMCVLAAMADERAVLQAFVGIYNGRLERRKAAALRGRSEAQYEQVEVVDEDW